MKKMLVALVLLIVSLQGVYSQEGSDSTQFWQITTTDGNTFQGYIVDETPTQITFKTFTFGEVIILKYMIKSKKLLSESAEKRVKKTKDQPELIDENSLWRIVTEDGFDFVGIIVSKNDQYLELNTVKFGTMKISRTTIKSMVIIKDEQFVDGEVWFENPQGSRYFYSPNGYGLRKGEGYYQNVWVMFNQASYGFNDYFTMGIGTIPVFLFGAGLDFTPFWLTPKVSFPIIEDVFNVGAGVMAIGIPGEVAVALTYGVATLGDRNRNLNFGMGYGYSSEGEWAKHPLITLSGMIRLSKKSYLLSENFIVSFDEETIVLAMLGGRTIWPRLSLDYGLVVPFMNSMGGFVAIPWLGFVIPFGNTGNK